MADLRSALAFTAFLAVDAPATTSFALTRTVTATATPGTRDRLASYDLAHDEVDWDRSAPIDHALARLWFLDASSLRAIEPTERARRIDAVTVPDAVRAATAAGQQVVILNSILGQLAELAEPVGGHYHGESPTATLRISNLSDCRLDPATARLITPHTGDLTRFTEQRAVRLANDRRRAASRAAKKAARQDSLTASRDTEHRLWSTSPYYARTVETFGSVPWWMTLAPGGAAPWGSDPALWRAVIWFDLINAPDPDDARPWRTLDDATQTLAKRGIGPRPGYAGQDEALLAYIDSLAGARLIERHFTRQGQLLGFRLPAPYVEPSAIDVTQSPAERMLAAIHLRPYAAVVRSTDLWLQRFPNAKTLPSIDADGKVRFEPRRDIEASNVEFPADS